MNKYEKISDKNESILNRSYRSVFLVQNRDWWHSCPFTIDKNQDLVLSFDFGLVHLIAAEGGAACYIDHLLDTETMEKYNHEMYAVWRKHNKGFSNSLTKDIKTIFRHKKTYLDFFNQLYDYKFDKVIKAQYQWDYEDWFTKLKKDFKIKECWNFIRCFYLKEYYKIPKGFKNKLVYFFPTFYTIYFKIHKSNN